MMPNGVIFFHRDQKYRTQQHRTDLSRCIKGAKPSSGGSARIPNLCCPFSPGPLHAFLHTLRQTCIQGERATITVFSKHPATASFQTQRHIQQGGTTDTICKDQRCLHQGSCKRHPSWVSRLAKSCKATRRCKATINSAGNVQCTAGQGSSSFEPCSDQLL